MLILGLISSETTKKPSVSSQKENESFENIINHMKLVNSKIEIEKSNWHTIGSIAEFNFTIKNKNNFKVKDIVIECKFYAPSKTITDKEKRKIYVEIYPNKNTTIKDFSFGFINSQAKSSSCEVINATYDKIEFKMEYEKIYDEDKYFEKNYNFITLATK